MKINTTRLAAAALAAFSLIATANDAMCGVPDAPNATGRPSMRRVPLITPRIEQAVRNVRGHTLVIPNSIQSADDNIFLFGALIRYGISALTVRGDAENAQNTTALFFQQMAAFNYPFRSLSFENINIENIIESICSFPVLTNISIRNCGLTDNGAERLAAAMLNNSVNHRIAPNLHFSDERAITDPIKLVINLQLTEVGGTVIFD